MAKFKRQKKTFSFKIYLLLQFFKNALKHSEYNFNLIINNPLIKYFKNLCRIFFIVTIYTFFVISQRNLLKLRPTA